MATLEEIAAYRPGVLSRLANVLTGGLSGAVTGQAERANEAAYARRALLNEQLQEQQLERAAQRARMNALRASFEEAGGMLGPDAQPDLQTMAMMAQRQRQAAQEAGAQGTLAGLGQQTPAPEDASVLPFYRMGQAKAQAQLGEAKAMRGINQEEQRAIDAALLEQRGIPTAGMTPQQVAARASIERPAATAVAQQEAWAMGTQRQQGAKARAELVARQARGEIPSPVDVSNLSDLEAMGMLAAIPQQTAGEIKFGREREAQAKYEDLANRFNQGQITRDELQEQTRSIYHTLPKATQNRVDVMRAADIPSKLSNEESKALVSNVNGAIRFVELGNQIDRLLSLPGMTPEKAQRLFSSPVAKFRNVALSMFPANSEEARLITAIQSNFEKNVSGDRKEFFGVSLSAGEQAAAERMYGRPDSALFLPMALQFADQFFMMDPLARFSGKSIGRQNEELLSAAQQQWSPIRDKMIASRYIVPSSFKRPGMQPQQPSAQPVAPQQQGQQESILEYDPATKTFKRIQ